MKKKIVNTILMSLICTSMFTTPAFAAPEVYEMRECITHLEYENEKLKDAIFNIFSDEEWELLTRTAVAEAGYNVPEAQKNVAYVIFNRMKSHKFPNALTDVIYQPNQFEVVSRKMINTVTITEEDIDNMKDALLTNLTEEEVAQGALFFCQGSTNVAGFLFKDEVGHVFTK